MGIKQAISNLAARAVLAALDSSRKCQAAGLKLIAGDTKENVEYIEPYGFTSTAHAGAEAVVLFPSGDRSHGVVISVSDRRYRLKGLRSGEVAVYTDEGDSIVLKRGRVTEITTSELVVNAESKISLNAPQLVVNASSGVSFTTPTITTSGDFSAAGEVSDGVGTMSAIRTTYNGHKHTAQGKTAETTGPSASMG
ncbi:phage baseplate assembly protein V [Cronobacter sakazakii]|uniref:phage baseplate assembly protein V n=1 Tax=Cronobacter sakazakii TaxID=28141 RepID=UPI0013FBF342|nr:phage baseplate assembly protein V [Cronobacter sakazakii]ELY4100554.1 phage baseplate assembly protein [Cronobacter sakazakii]KAB1481732.1 phage baseplate assembly protein V [Cronobacter sakazakii]MEB8575158.1 phage baseplate assembly protein V [Cronobacter sakazakii]MEB8607965.1 phage baseplate assembly protein V [Cronobacter sakazakii]